MKFYYYLDQDKNGESLLRIQANKKPIKRSRPYVIRILDNGKFIMPCFPEITFNRLSKAIYLGSTLATNQLTNQQN